MRDRMRASPLMDVAGFAREVEDAYRTMWRDWSATPVPATTSGEVEGGWQTVAAPLRRPGDGGRCHSGPLARYSGRGLG